jgi:molecular chaperone DnaK (HSP70)
VALCAICRFPPDCHNPLKVLLAALPELLKLAVRRLHRGRPAPGRAGGEAPGDPQPGATIYSAKRFIGRKWGEVDEEAKIVSYKVVKGPNDAVRFEVRSKQYAPEEISAQVLRKLADDFDKRIVDWLADEFKTTRA